MCFSRQFSVNLYANWGKSFFLLIKWFFSLSSFSSSRSTDKKDSGAIHKLQPNVHVLTPLVSSTESISRCRLVAWIVWIWDSQIESIRALLVSKCSDCCTIAWWSYPAWWKGETTWDILNIEIVNNRCVSFLFSTSSSENGLNSLFYQLDSNQHYESNFELPWIQLGNAWLDCRIAWSNKQPEGHRTLIFCLLHSVESTDHVRVRDACGSDILFTSLRSSLGKCVLANWILTKSE